MGSHKTKLPGTSRPVQLVWFKRDLRLHDNAALAAAARHGPVLPVFAVEPDYWQQPDVSARQWEFVRESLMALDKALRKAGSRLVLQTGEICTILAELKTQTRFQTLWSHEETGNDWTYQRDRAVMAWCKANGVVWNEIPQNGVTRRLKSRNGWAATWEQRMNESQIPEPLLEPAITNDGSEFSVPSANQLGLNDDPCPFRQKGGRPAGLETLSSFLHERGEDYQRAMSSPVTAFDACSRMSPHLAWGTVSMKETAQAARQRHKDLNREYGKTKWKRAMVSFTGRLHWHCHFMQKLEDEPRLEFENLHGGYDGMRPLESDVGRLHAWSVGETGLPFVDACMRALNHSGWLNFRMRAMLMAVSSYHLWLHWGEPGEHLARKFTDYEAGIHWPQVQMQSGTTGINTIRIYNPVKQGLDQDKNGTFIRRWVPELDAVPDRFIHEPWTWDEAGRVLGRTYPFPVINHLQAAREARQKVWAVRGGPGFSNHAKAIQNKHGSRKSGIPQRSGKVPNKRGQDGSGQQLSLFEED